MYNLCSSAKQEVGNLNINRFFVTRRYTGVLTIYKKIAQMFGRV